MTLFIREQDTRKLLSYLDVGESVTITVQPSAGDGYVMIESDSTALGAFADDNPRTIRFK